MIFFFFFFFSSRRRHTRLTCDWSSDVALPIFSLPVGTEMFHFPTLPPPALCVQAGAMGHYAPSGFPIQIGRASCRERVSISVVGEYFTEKCLIAIASSVYIKLSYD